MTQPAAEGVTVPPGLARPLVDAAILGLAARARRDGGAPPFPGLAALLAELDMSARPELGTHFPRMAEPSWLAAGEAARLTGTSARYVRRLAASGRLRARKRGWAWEIDADSARDYGRERRRGTGDDDHGG